MPTIPVTGPSAIEDRLAVTSPVVAATFASTLHHPQRDGQALDCDAIIKAEHLDVVYCCIIVTVVEFIVGS